MFLSFSLDVVHCVQHANMSVLAAAVVALAFLVGSAARSRDKVIVAIDDVPPSIRSTLHFVISNLSLLFAFTNKGAAATNNNNNNNLHNTFAARQMKVLLLHHIP